MKIVTISREYGAGGHSIGRKVAEQLQVPFYDRDILRETAKASGYDLEMIEREQEDVSRADSIWKSICAASSGYFQDTHTAIHELQEAIILRLAGEGPCVILGHCADDILAKAGMESLNVFIHADQLHRAKRVKELTGAADPGEIQKLMTKKDGSRHNYYTHYTGKRWGDSRNYHLSLDSGILGYEMCTRFIVEAAQQN